MIKKLNYITNLTNRAYLYLPEAVDSEYLGDKFWLTKDGEELLKFFGEGL